MGEVVPPWTVPLSEAQHDLILFGLVAAALALLATLVRVRFTSAESHGEFRVASLTASAVVAIAFVSYLTLITAFAVGYRELPGGGYEPTAMARFAWELRYMDWVITVPLLAIELIAISALSVRRAVLTRRVAMVAAVAMIGFGFLGAFIVDEGTDRLSYTLFGVAGAVCFAVLYGLFTATMLTSLPRLPEPARVPYRTAVVVLLTVWLLYPITYGLLGSVQGAWIAVVGQLLLCTADMIAKIGFGTLVHRTSVLRSRSDEDLDPTRPRRPRSPSSDSVYVNDTRRFDFDPD